MSGRLNLPVKLRTGADLSGQVLFLKGNSIDEAGTKLTIDDDNDRVGILTNSPETELEVNGDTKTEKLGIGIAPTEDLNIYGMAVTRFHDTITLATDAATTTIDLTPGGLILSAAIRVSTEILGIDAADHHLQLGITGTTDKYIDKAHGASLIKKTDMLLAHQTTLKVQKCLSL